LARTRVTAVSRSQGNNEAVKNGTVALSRFELDFVEVPVLPQAFRRMIRGQEFDVCEMAITTYLCAKAHSVPITALPVFLVRGFHHGAILVNSRSGIRSPRDLEGGRIGVSRGYTVTTGVWARDILASEYNVDLGNVTWVCSDEEHVSTFQRPRNVLQIEQGDSLDRQLIAGELDAIVGLDWIDHRDIRPLIQDPAAASMSAFVRDGLYPINHLIVVKDETLANHPGLGLEVAEAFTAAKNLYVDRLAGGITSPSATDTMYRAVLESTGADPLPYGVEPNRKMLERLLSQLVAQEILETTQPLDDLFAPETRGFVG
jgi:hypothetical protein